MLWYNIWRSKGEYLVQRFLHSHTLAPRLRVAGCVADAADTVVYAWTDGPDQGQAPASPTQYTNMEWAQPEADLAPHTSDLPRPRTP